MLDDTETTPAESPTEAVHPESGDLDRLEPEQVVALMVRDEERTLRALRGAQAAIGSVARAASDALRAGGSIVFVGAGTSGRLGVIEAAECPPTFSSSPDQVRAIMAGGQGAFLKAIEGAEDDAAAGAQAAREAKVGGRDLVIGIAASGRTPFVRGALEEARSLGARTALVTSNPAVATEGPQPAHNVCVLDTGPEVLSGSTRLKAGTATKMALNAITTAAFASVGKVYGNLMVDLMATNKKLEARSARIVQRLCTLDEAAAQVALQRAGGRLKEAVVMHELAVTIEQASAQLKEASGCLRRALAHREDEEEAEPEGDDPQR